MLSIIVPVYNGEKYVQECIQSILNQTFADFELLIIDDGSQDDSFAICDYFARSDPRVRLFSKKHGGVANARNFGIEKANREFISFCDSDDVVSQDLYQKLVDIMCKKKVDRMCSGYCLLYEKNRKVLRKPRIADGEYNSKELLKNMIDDGTMSGILFSSVNNSLFKKEIIDKYNIRFNESVRFNEDGLFSVEYMLHSNNVYSIQSQITYYYRQISSLKLTERLTTNDYQKVNEELHKLNHLYDIDDYDLQMCRRKITELLWWVLMDSKHDSFFVAVKKIREHLKSYHSKDNIELIEPSRLNGYKKIYYYLIKYKAVISLVLVSRWFVPILSKYLER